MRKINYNSISDKEFYMYNRKIYSCELTGKKNGYVKKE